MEKTYGEFIADQLAAEDEFYDIGTDDFDPGNYAGWE